MIEALSGGFGFVRWGGTWRIWWRGFGNKEMI
jgi:hypothetical protein